MVGRYEYGFEPSDIYRRHDNCGCTVVYECGNKRQDVWSKRSWDAKRIDEPMAKPTVLTPQQAEALEQRNLQYRGLTNSRENAIINEENKQPITNITDESISNVPKIIVNGYSDEECEFIQNQHKELLEYSRNNNESNECAFVFDGDLSNRREYTGTSDSLVFGSELFGKDLFVMHNHPRGGSYSAKDIIFILSNDNIKNLSIVKNNGGLEVLTKTSQYNSAQLITSFRRIIKDTVKQETNAEYNKAVEKFLSKHSKEGGMFEWKK